MKANQHARTRPDDRAEVGVGTLIVFIAMVLVAAVAAAVLINTTGTLQQRAQATGKEATQEVSSNLKVISVYGHRNATSGGGDDVKLHKLKLSLELSAGALPMDLTRLVIRVADLNGAYNYKYGWQEGNGFNTTWVRGNNNTAVMSAGDLVEIELHGWPLNAGFAERRTVEVTLIPESGAAVLADFKTPPTYGTQKVVTLR